MKQYGLGPNGGIVTALNLFATQFNEVITLCQKRQDEIDYILLDTPGQIEGVFWGFFFWQNGCSNHSFPF